MDSQKKTPKKVNRIKSHMKAGPEADPGDVFVGILDAKVEAVMVGSGIERESVMLGHLTEEELEYVDTLTGADAADYIKNFERECEADLDNIIQIDTYVIRDEESYERKFKKSE